MDRPEVSVLVNTYEKPWHLQRCLVSLACQSTAGRMEVIVVDDGSRDETGAVVAAFARQAPFPVKFLSHSHDGFQLCRCRNEGAATAAADKFLFFDGDLIAGPDHVAEHLRQLVPGVVTNSYCVRMDDELSRQIDEASIRSGEFIQRVPRQGLAHLATMYRKAWFYSLIRHPNKPRARGGDLGVTRADFEKVNGFDENFRAWGGEDDDFGFRLRKIGAKVKYIMNRTRSYHLWHPPHPTRPDKLRDGLNEAYLRRAIRLTRCVRGLEKRTLRDLTVSLCGTADNHAALVRVLRSRFQWPQALRQGPADIEILPFPGHGRFTGTADANLLVVTEPEASVPSSVLKRAQIVLSPLGNIGARGQMVLRLEDEAGLAAALGWRISSGSALLPRRALRLSAAAA